MDENKIVNGQEIPEDEIVVLLDENDKECEFQILLTYDYGDSMGSFRGSLFFVSGNEIRQVTGEKQGKGSEAPFLFRWDDV